MKRLGELLDRVNKFVDDAVDTSAIFVTDIEKDTVYNSNFRKIVFTGKHLQVSLMSIKPGETVGKEVHDDTDQFFRIESGEGKLVAAGKTYQISDGSAFVVPAGTVHDIANTGTEDLRLYTLYGPPQHKDGLIQKTKPEDDK